VVEKVKPELKKLSPVMPNVEAALAALHLLTGKKEPARHRDR